jgi:hypothetical protein
VHTLLDAMMQVALPGVEAEAVPDRFPTGTPPRRLVSHLIFYASL